MAFRVFGLLLLAFISYGIVPGAESELLRMVARPGAVNRGAMAFTDDGKLLVCEDYMVLECSNSTGVLEKVHHAYQSETMAICGIPGTSRVASATKDGRLVLWDRSGDLVYAVARLTPLSWSPPDYNYARPKLTASDDGRMLAVVFGTGTIFPGPFLKIYDTGTLSWVGAPDDVHFSSVAGAIFSPDGETVYAAARESVYARPYDKGLEIVEWNLADDSTRVVDATIAPFHLGAMVRTESGFEYSLGLQNPIRCDGPSSICCGIGMNASYGYIPWSCWVATPGSSSTAMVEGVRTMCFCGAYSCPADYPDLKVFVGPESTLSPRGRYLLRRVSLWFEQRRLQDLQTGTTITAPDLADGAFSSDEAHFVGYRYNTPGPIYEIIDLASSESKTLFPTPVTSDCDGIALAAERRRLTTIMAYQATLNDLDSGMAIEAHSIPTTPGSTLGTVVSACESYIVAYTKDGAIVGSADAFGTYTLLLDNRSVTSASVNPVNDRLALASGELVEYEVDCDDFSGSRLVRTYDAGTGPEVEYKCASYTPSGDVLVAAGVGSRYVIHFFNTTTGELVSESILNNRWNKVWVDPSGELMLADESTGSGDRLVLLRLATMERIDGFSPPAQAFSFLMNGRALMLADGSLWRTDPSEVLGRIASLSGRPTTWMSSTPSGDLVYTADDARVFEWRLPLADALDAPARLVEDALLRQEAILVPADRNGDGILDSADLLLAGVDNRQLLDNDTRSGTLQATPPGRHSP